MPAEWEPHAATWLSWPRNRVTWPGVLLKDVERVYREMIAALLPHERVNLLVASKAEAARVLKGLDASKAPLSHLAFHRVRTVDTWIRDYGPLFVVGTRAPKKAFTKWIFNAWGGKYKDLARDTGAVDRIEALKNVTRFDVRRVMEGGSIDLNGRGTCLTTEQCLLNPGRNPGLSREGIERLLAENLGARHVVWLKEGIEGDDTDGHVDDITRFVGPSTIVTVVEGDRSDKNHAILKENLEILRRSADQDGRRFRVVELPMPGRVGIGRRDGSHDRLPASYANFYIANGTVLVPVYSHPNDKGALKVIKSQFKDRKIVAIECSSLVYGLGSIHCVTQQEPA